MTQVVSGFSLWGRIDSRSDDSAWASFRASWNERGPGPGRIVKLSNLLLLSVFKIEYYNGLFIIASFSNFMNGKSYDYVKYFCFLLYITVVYAKWL